MLGACHTHRVEGGGIHVRCLFAVIVETRGTKRPDM